LDTVQIALVDSGKLALVVERRSHPRRRGTDRRDDVDAKVARVINAVLDGPPAEVKPYEGQ
jgi:hypothetical protein